MKSDGTIETDDFKWDGPLNVRQPAQVRLEKQRGFKEEYRLASGIPIFSVPLYMGQATGYQMVSMARSLIRGSTVAMWVPEELLYEDVPKFDLILRLRKPRRKK